MISAMSEFVSTGTMAPTRRVRWDASALAVRSGVYPVSRSTASTRSRVRMATRSGSRITRTTVIVDTPARSATSARRVRLRVGALGIAV